MYYYGFDSYYLMLVVPAFIFSLYAQFKVKSTFDKYSQYRNWRGITGAEMAREILWKNGLHDVQVVGISGHLTDHYDPRSKVVRLSESVFSGTSIAAIGVAAHETGHALQHKEKYLPLTLRASLVPVASFGSSLGPYLAIFGIIFNYGVLINLGLVLFAGAVAFYLITLPVEFNASKRAIEFLESSNSFTSEEIKPVKKVLGAAAMTYVASAAVAMANLARLLLLAGNRRNND